MYYSELKVRKDGFKKVMEDISFFNQIRKKIVKVTCILPGKKKNNGKKESMQAKHTFFLFITYIYKRSETIYKFEKTSMYNHLQRKKIGLNKNKSLKIHRGVFFLFQCADRLSHPQPPREGKERKKRACKLSTSYKISKKSTKLFTKKGFQLSIYKFISIEA